MSWDARIIKTNRRIAAICEIKESDLTQLGDADIVRSRIMHAMPEIEWSTASHGVTQQQGWSIEFDISGKAIVESLGIAVRGNGNPFPKLADLCKQNKWLMIDVQTSEILDLDTMPPRSWGEFTSYRDRAIRQVDTR
jgi:hypothetical protein